MNVGTIHGVGLGSGDPDLMTVRAHRLLTETRHVAFFRKAGRTGQARKIIQGLLRDDVVEYPMEYPVTTEIALTDPEYNRQLSGFYTNCAAHLLECAKSGEDVVVLSEGDPFFYGSFMHIYERVRDHAPVQVVPAVTGMSAAWTATGEPITWGDDILTVLMATLSEEELTARMKSTDALVVMKIGRNIDKVRAALVAAGKYDDAWLVEYASMPEQTVQKLSAAQGRAVPYFSIVIVHGQGRRP